MLCCAQRRKGPGAERSKDLGFFFLLSVTAGEERVNRRRRPVVSLGRQPQWGSNGEANRDAVYPKGYAAAPLRTVRPLSAYNHSYVLPCQRSGVPTKPTPDPRVVAWLHAHERDIAVDPVIPGELRFGILILRKGRK